MPLPLSMFSETVTVTPAGQQDAFGAETTPTARTVQAFIEQGARLVRDKSGREVVSMSRVFLLPTDTAGAAITPTAKDHITLPEGYEPQSPQIISVNRYNGRYGVHHFEVAV